MNIFNTYKGLPRSIYALFFVQIINRFGDFVFPFLSLLLTQKLNFSYSITGVIVMITSLVSMPAALLGGKFADQISRRKTYFVGQGLAAVAILICGIIKNPIIIVVLLIISAFFNGFVRPTLSAIIADALTPEKRQIGGSLTYLGINIGVAVGPIVAGFLFNNYISLLFILDALTSFIAIIIFYIYIDETKPKLNVKEDENSKEKEETGNLLQILLKRPQLTLFMIFNMFYCFAYTQISFSMPMMLNEVFGTEGTTKFGYLMSINALTVIFLTVIIITITRRLTTLVNIILAGIFYAIGFGMIGIIGNSFFLYIISTIIWSIGEVIASTNNGVYIANNSPKNFRARISAVSNLTYAISISLATSLVGRFIDSYGLNKVWTLVFVVVAVGVGFMIALHIYNLKSKKKAVKHREVAC
ncbi:MULTISPECIES: MDR family MFS transporter [Clostridium]|uniref:Major facilitator superfamily MFS_1 n=1 Tax=Clostridium saccharoperbutylacetonicum N1-4(HMT) TaxID=931276 RepID=M1MUV0_9CLOT|nr:MULTISPECIES: MFS transporter [Clostridium]AGF55287.1 major facilitator superfamily MFS_1 [Clostridium saccharoperbutylacetonicum N1-4(HMT)]AQR94173.1 multidrug resistance protein MdtH [Clostridium saccharoperbutylacetonicum]NRT64000.1 MFS family permease [Clostridium saccharoperbutylacetonicum]NSB27367.1 MFS family permease [Clostridium saccharoperbutylacetonicum]NSB29873.1 MFS family permease [Clostridium saccharoperbutylacetonicum]